MTRRQEAHLRSILAQDHCSFIIRGLPRSMIEVKLKEIEQVYRENPPEIPDTFKEKEY